MKDEMYGVAAEDESFGFGKSGLSVEESRAASRIAVAHTAEGSTRQLLGTRIFASV